MDFQLLPLAEARRKMFKKDMREAFQKGAADGLGEAEEEILPESHIDRSLAEEGAFAYEAILDGQPVGGAIVVIDEETRRNRLDFLYVKVGVQSRGIGRKIWKAIEERYPQTLVWETCTPYFEKRNIHFYMNCLGFHAVEFFNSHHRDPNDPDEAEQESSPEAERLEGMFRFEKEMR